jgi:hypothetical protein
VSLITAPPTLEKGKVHVRTYEDNAPKGKDLIRAYQGGCVPVEGLGGRRVLRTNQYPLQVVHRTFADYLLRLLCSRDVIIIVGLPSHLPTYLLVLITMYSVQRCLHTTTI